MRANKLETATMELYQAIGDHGHPPVFRLIPSRERCAGALPSRLAPPAAVTASPCASLVTGSALCRALAALLSRTGKQRRRNDCGGGSGGDGAQRGIPANHLAGCRRWS
jgi:hypothetical protein